VARRVTLGDIVTMPLPTEWGPEVLPAGNGVAVSYVNQPGLAPTGGNGGPGGIPGGPGAIAVGSPDGLAPGQGPNGLRIPGTTVGGGFPSPAAWRPDVILPDWLLPPALQRGNPLLRRATWTPNRWDMKLVAKARAFAWIAAHGGLKTCCRVPELGSPIWSQPPWQVMPSNGIEYRQMFSQPLSTFQDGDGNFTGLLTVIGQWRVELGFDGVLNQFVCGFTGTGFNDFSGDITWRVQVDNRPAKNLGAVVNTFGTFADAFLVPGYGIRLVSGQTVTLYASVVPGAGIADGNITAGTFGWTYPRR
jgi:hypothetical protein